MARIHNHTTQTNAASWASKESLNPATRTLSVREIRITRRSRPSTASFHDGLRSRQSRSLGQSGSALSCMTAERNAPASFPPPVLRLRRGAGESLKISCTRHCTDLVEPKCMRHFFFLSNAANGDDRRNNPCNGSHPQDRTAGVPSCDSRTRIRANSVPMGAAGPLSKMSPLKRSPTREAAERSRTVTGGLIPTLRLPVNRGDQNAFLKHALPLWHFNKPQHVRLLVSATPTTPAQGAAFF